MKKRFNWDAMGIFVSVACAIHCALLPLFLTSLPLLGINIIHNQAFEVAMIAMAFAVGARALYHGFKEHHHSILPITLFAAGMLCLLAKQIWHKEELLFLIPAVVLIVTAHLFNYKSCKIGHYRKQ
ncbi:MAG TPA: MerC domain-containing protein [Chitinophagaceae bacterium]|nr:MerC domain-containing protein [Chitinophagaceae bacterium]